MAPTQDKPSKKPSTKKALAKPKAARTQTVEPGAPRRRAPTHQAIANRAYELSQGGRGGDDVSHWLQAEHELTRS